MIEPTVGLQISQPSPPRASSRPCESSSSAYEVMRRARTISYSSLAGVREAAAQALVDLAPLLRQ